MSGRGQILVIRGGAIGDFILTLPVFRALRNQFPGTRLEVLGYPHIASLAKIGGLVDASRAIEARALAGFFTHGLELPSDLSEYFAQFDVILSYLYDPDELFQGNVLTCASAQFLQGPHRPEETGPGHATASLLQPLERLAIFDADPVPRLELPEKGVRDARCVAVHPGSGSEAKNWPEPKWHEFLNTLADSTDWQFLMVGGEAEGDRLVRLSAALPASRCKVARHLPLGDLARRLATCGLFIGHDSGISHLAAAVGTPCVLLWGPTAEGVWRPLGDHVRLIKHGDGLNGLPVNDVVRMARAPLP